MKAYTCTRWMDHRHTWRHRAIISTRYRLTSIR